MTKVTIDRDLLERIGELMHIIAHRQDDYGVEAEYLGSLLKKAIAHPTQQGEEVEVVEVVGYRFFHVDHGYIFRRTHIYEGNPSLEAHSLMTVAQHERILAAATRPADQVAESVVVSRELLENCADYMMGSASARVRIWHDQCRALLAAAPATPAAQVAVPDVSAMARVLSDRVADACCVDPDDNWKIYGQDYITDVRAMLAAAPAHPAERQEQGEVHSAAARDVLAERRRQIEAEGMTTAGDDGYHAAELPRAAASYILNGANDEAPAIWPWAKAWWKPRDARTNYVRAGALILAEIERLDRAALAASTGQEVEK